MKKIKLKTDKPNIELRTYQVACQVNWDDVAFVMGISRIQLYRYLNDSNLSPELFDKIKSAITQACEKFGKNEQLYNDKYKELISKLSVEGRSVLSQRLLATLERFEKSLDKHEDFINKNKRRHKYI
jgi:hypothetical protein